MKIINEAFCGKKVPANRIYTGKRALHEINGFINMVIMRSFLFSKIRVDIMAGTLQPNPITKGIKDLPCNPILCIKLSRIKTASVLKSKIFYIKQETLIIQIMSVKLKLKAINRRVKKPTPLTVTSSLQISITLIY